MESQHMTQQVFADYIGLAPATLSSIFNDRTRPTLNVVEAIKKKIPNISTDWLMFGSGDMFLTPSGSADSPSDRPSGPADSRSTNQSPMLDFDQPLSPTPQPQVQMGQYYNGVKSTRPEIVREEVKIVDKPQRRVVEIRVFYDDQTWESFVPGKK